MTSRITGAFLIIAGCGSLGIRMVRNQMHQEKLLRKLIMAVTFMEQELQYRLTPLPELLRSASRQVKGEIGVLLNRVASELDSQILPDVTSCMDKILQQTEFPGFLRKILRNLGLSLGNFDLSGQLAGLRETESFCRAELQKMEEGKRQRYRSYETLGVCTGAALVILLI